MRIKSITEERGGTRLRGLFSLTFPNGRTGIALLLLRGAVGLSAVIQGGAYLFGNGNSTLRTWVVGLLVTVAGASLLIGLLTPIACILIGLCSVGLALSWLPTPVPNLFETNLSLLFVVVMTTTLVLSGPGAFSLDARLFGRREIIIPRTSRPPES